MTASTARTTLSPSSAPSEGAAVEELFTLFWREPAPEPLIMGRDLMGELGVPEGNLIGRLLGAVSLAEAQGRVSTRDEALAYARELLESGEL